MTLRLASTSLIVFLGCSSSQRVESANEAELNRSAGRAPDEGGIQATSEGAQAPQRTPASAPEPLPSGPSSLPGPIIETSCQATEANSDPLFPACGIGCSALIGGMLDRENQCVQTVILACTFSNFWQSALTCQKRLSDKVLIRSSIPEPETFGPEWVACTEEDWADWPDVECSR